MEASRYPTTESRNSRWIAPGWHLLLILLLVLGFAALAALGAHLHGLTPHPQRQGLALGYLFAMTVEWVMVAVVWLGIRLRKVSLRNLVGGRWESGRAVLRDLGIVALFFVASNLVSAVLTQFLKVDAGRAVRDLLPHSEVEVALYLMMALTAGICEEIVFRGYLQRQFTALTGNAGAAVVAQGILFAVFHGNQGLKFMAIVGVYGCLLGALAWWRRSLRPGMIAHFLQDGLVGVLAPYLFK
jgi:hypothetical protein